MESRFNDKVALITGGGSGIGRAIAPDFAQEGAKVVVVSNVATEVEEVRTHVVEAGGECLAITADVTRLEEVQRFTQAAVAQFGTIDILINCAGATIEKMVVDMDPHDWDVVQDVNLKAVFLAGHEIMKIMIQHNFGKIVNIASISGKVSAASATGAAYCSSKAGVISLTAVMAAEVKRYDININALLPARTNTAMFRKYHPNYRDVVGLMEPEDIAKVVLFLCSEDARCIKGVAVEVSNGQELLDWDGTES